MSVALIEHRVDAIELAVRLLDRALDLAQQRHGLLAHRVDRHLRALEHVVGVDQHDAQAQDEQDPAGGDDDEGGVARGCDESHIRASRTRVTGAA